MVIEGYKYLSEADAITAQTSLNTHYGIPVSADAITRNWCSYNHESTSNFWYITWDSSFNVVLGDPISITLPDPEGT
jgi:hypothetical protein